MRKGQALLSAWSEAIGKLVAAAESGKGKESKLAHVFWFFLQAVEPHYYEQRFLERVVQPILHTNDHAFEADCDEMVDGINVKQRRPMSQQLAPLHEDKDQDREVLV